MYNSYLFTAYNILCLQLAAGNIIHSAQMSLSLFKSPAITLAAVVMNLAQCHTSQVKSTMDAAADSSTRQRHIHAAVPLKNMFGINSYEWNFLENPAAPNNRNGIYEDNMALIKSFSAVRHYLNWNKLESTEGNYTYNPTNNGNWNYDLIYTRCKQDSILVLADIKNLPVWMMNSYPADQRNDENVPAYYNADRSSPKSYVVQAHTAFQFAARYGYNTKINPMLVKVDARPRWKNDRVNEVKIGMGLIKYIECGNENDRWWKGSKATQTPEEYAANLSAFYDGHKHTLGPNAGVKTADPGMQVVMGGLATADVNYVKRMVDWCKANRGYNADGTINLCFDVINYHLYSNDGSVLTHRKATTGVAPELSEAPEIAKSFIDYANSLPNHPPVWLTEAGYDINQGSYQKAPPIGTKTPLITQADWILRTSLLYARMGFNRLFFYQLFDAYPNKAQQYSTSGLAEGTKRRPAADYILQTSKLMGDYSYVSTLNSDPLVDKYQKGKQAMYVLTVPDQKGRTTPYTLTLGEGVKSATLYNLIPGSDTMKSTQLKVNNGKVTIQASETPVFVQPFK
ncbi:hypothetical protein DYU05_03435 [Mucilaginibacter terrenus]|uniref:Glycoside hydrolase family 42 N-terminal domain-containing protein n=1 Tax=Mucilaginibacter terrenus TaxID=2482727 RepID=A0A3E2NUI3_9SPHI|nr:hypothetical protein [Mucilaginibacter terrenus]RFZ84674.1 hypothetical protein DYU05_03435 [Mucilaginibacter terrenus]